MQVSASGAGECVMQFLVETKSSFVASLTTTATADIAGIAANVRSELDFVSGCELGPVRPCDVAQQVLLWQQPISHAVRLGVFVTKHGVAGNRTATAKSPIASATGMAILLTINYWIA
jgi:hypothetical protein